MSLDIVSESTEHLPQYARVPSAILVTEMFDADAVDTIAARGEASPVRLARPYWKDYDSYPDNAPIAWTHRFDVTSWRVLAAYDNGERIGGAVLILDQSQIDLIEGPVDGAVLWDLRVAPGMRRRGIGRALVGAACGLASAAGRDALWVETQNVNVPACRLYQACGFTLAAVRRNAYPELPGEHQLLWRRDTTGCRESDRTPTVL